MKIKLDTRLPTYTMNRALLTEREREVLRGEATDVEHPTKYRSNTRGRVQTRIQHLHEDLQVLNEHEPELAQQIREAVNESADTDALQQILAELREHRENVES